MSPFEYALAAMLCFGIADVIYKRGGLAGLPPHQLLMVQSWVFLPSVAVFGLFAGSLRFVTATLWGAFAGLFMTIGFYNFAHSLKSGLISIDAPIFRLNFIITAVLAMLVLGEPVLAVKIVGIVLALAATWLLLGAPATADGPARHESASSLLRVLLATVAVGLGNLIYKFGLRSGATPLSLIVAQAFVVVALSTCLAAAVDRRIRPSGAALRYAPPAGLVLAVGFVTLVKSLAGGDASVMVPIAQMGFTVTALVGFAFLHEPLTMRKAAGLTAAIAALASFAMANG